MFPTWRPRLGGLTAFASAHYRRVDFNYAALACTHLHGPDEVDCPARPRCWRLSAETRAPRNRRRAFHLLLHCIPGIAGALNRADNSSEVQGAGHSLKSRGNLWGLAGEEKHAYRRAYQPSNDRAPSVYANAKNIAKLPHRRGGRRATATLRAGGGRHASVFRHDLAVMVDISNSDDPQVWVAAAKWLCEEARAQQGSGIDRGGSIRNSTRATRTLLSLQGDATYGSRLQWWRRRKKRH